MYFYLLHEFDDYSVLSHNHLFTNEEFQAMCEEAPKDTYIIDGNLIYSIDNIGQHLTSKYGIKYLEFQCDFFAHSCIK